MKGLKDEDLVEVQLEESNLLEFILSPANLDGSCSGSQKMKNNAQIEMKLSPARYTIVTIAGLGEEYVIPENPRLDDVIVMRAGNRSARAMMMGTVLSNLFSVF